MGARTEDNSNDNCHPPPVSNRSFVKQQEAAPHHEEEEEEEQQQQQQHTVVPLKPPNYSFIKGSSKYTRPLIVPHTTYYPMNPLNEWKKGLNTKNGGYINRLSEIQSVSSSSSVPMDDVSSCPTDELYDQDDHHHYYYYNCRFEADDSVNKELDALSIDLRTTASTASLTLDKSSIHTDDEDEEDLMESIISGSDWDEFLYDDYELDELLDDQLADNHHVSNSIHPTHEDDEEDDFEDDEDYDILGAILDGHFCKYRSNDDDSISLNHRRSFLEHKDSFRVAIDTSNNTNTKFNKNTNNKDINITKADTSQQQQQQQQQPLTRRKSCPSLGENDLSQPSEQRRSLVSFDSVQIREYGLSLGDHPECRYGPPLALDWEYHDLGKLRLDDYESTRQRARNRCELLVNAFHRKNLLRNVGGYSDREINKATKLVRKTQRQRKKTEQMLKVGDKVEQMTKGARRKIIRVVRRDSSGYDTKMKREILQAALAVEKYCAQRKEEFDDSELEPLRQMYLMGKSLRAPSA